MSETITIRILRGLLRVFSRLAPAAHRQRWLKEWNGELSHRPSAASFFSAMGLLFTALKDTRYLHALTASSASTGVGTPPLRQLGPDGPTQATAMFSHFIQDLRFSFRALRASPWFSLVTVLTLALGIGSSVAMFGVLHSAILRPLPFPEPDRLVLGRATFDGELNPWAAGADYYDYRDQSEAFQELAAIMPFPMDMTVSGEGDAERVSGNVASPNLFPALRVVPAAGRLFQPLDGADGSEAVVILSHGYWQRRMGGDPGAVGRAVNLDGNPHTVVGVLPPNFFFLAPSDLWLPMRPGDYGAEERDMHNWYLVGRLAPGMARTEAQADIDVISARLEETYPESNENKGLRLSGLHEVLTEDYQLSLWILTAAVGLVLLIACGNGAGIFLARAPARRFELSVRSAMGAPRNRLVRQLLAESLGLALAGGIVGTALAVWFQGMMLEYLAMEQLGPLEAELSLPVLAVAVGLSLLSGLLAGVYPSLRTAGGSLTEGLKAGHRIGGDGGSGFRSGLVVAQVALSVILLAGSGLLVRSLANLQTLDPGFDSENLLTAKVWLPRGAYPDAEARLQYVAALREELLSIPGVESVGLGSHLPIGDGGNTWQTYNPEREEEKVRTFLRLVYPGYMETLGIPVLSGRGIQETDQRGSRVVAVLSQTAAERLFPGENPIGKTFFMSTFQDPLQLEVVGVVGDVRLSRLEDEPEVALYMALPQRTITGLSVALKTKVPPMSLAGTFETAFRTVDPETPPYRVATLESLVVDSMAERRIITLSMTVLALLPLVLAAVGLFAVLAHHVSRRRHEIGVRMALGADASRVGGMVMKQGLGMVALGVGLGLGGALAATRLLRSLLFGVEAADPLTLVAVSILVLAVAALACLVPVLRAVRSDPRVALQTE
jgi:putative ABC transport system permease protein